MSVAGHPEVAGRPDQPLSNRSLVAILAAITAVGPSAVNIYLPALPVLRQHFATDVANVQLTVSVALLAFSVGLLAHGPLSDRFGRRPIVLIGLTIFNLGSLLCLVAPTLEWLIAGRAIQALGTSAGMIVSRAIVNDLYPREKMARMIAWLTMVTVIAPMLAPWVGGKLMVVAGWRSVFVLLTVAGILILWAAWRWLPETRVLRPSHLESHSVAAEASALLRQPAFLGYTIQGAVIFAVFFVFVSTMPSGWVEAKSALDLNTRFNLSTNNDIVGGNSGSPLVNAKGELVGLMFDGNIHSISGSYWFDVEKNRAIAVDPAIMKEALTKVYHADALVKEISGR